MADYGTLNGVKGKLNQNTGETSNDTVLAAYQEEADEFINTRVKLMNGSAAVLTDQELDPLADGLAASLYNYWTSPVKDIKGVQYYEQKIINFLKAKYSGLLDDEHTQNTFSKPNSRILGTE